MYQRLMMFATGLLCSLALSAQQYKPLDDSSAIGFGIKNFGVTVSGTLRGLKGSIHFDPSNLGTSSFVVTVDTKTLSTGIDMRDNHLKKEEYFYVDSFPQISFRSTKVTPSTKEGYLFIFGDLRIRNVTKSISFPFKATPNGDGYVFTGSFSINRRDYGVGGGSISMSDAVKVDLTVKAIPDK